MSEYTVRPVSALRLDLLLPEYIELLKPTQAHSVYRIPWEMVRERMVSGEYQALDVTNGDSTRPVGVTLFERRDDAHGGAALTILALAGVNLDAWQAQMFEALNREAVRIGAVQFLLEGRPGWQRKLQPLGFETRSITMGAAVNGRV